MDFDFLESIRIRALASIMKPTYEDFLSSVFEWYSKEYYTPLHIVPDLPLEDVLTAYYRYHYRSMEPDDRYNHAIWLLETPEERAARAAQDAQDEEAFLRKAAEQNANAKKNQKIKKIQEMLKKMRKPELPTKIPEPDPEPDPDPQEVTVKYMSEEEFERELEKGSGPPVKGNL